MQHPLESSQLTANQFQAISRLFSQQLFAQPDITGTGEYELENDLLEFIYTSINDNQCEFKSFHELRSLLRNFDSRNNILDEFSQGIVDKELITSVAEEHPDGKIMDTQGIIWEDDYMRYKMIHQRMNAFKSYTSLENSIERAKPQIDFKLRQINNTIFEFDKFYSMPKPRLIHFQLRNLITSLGHNSVYYPIENDDGIFQLMNLNTMNNETSVVMEYNPSFKTSTLTSNYNCICSGSVNGSINLYFPETQMIQEDQLSYEVNGITNYILPSKSDPTNELVIASNDKRLRFYDFLKKKVTRNIVLECPINCTCENPTNDNLIMMVGDSTRCMVLDKREPRNSNLLMFGNHLDYGFACDWNIDGNLMASGNQDGLVKFYDFRNLEQELITLSGCNHGAIRNLKFNKFGDKLCFAESIDNAYLVDLNKLMNDLDVDECYQNINFFGKVAGLEFELDDDGFGEVLNVGIGDSSVGGILRYRYDDYKNSIKDHDGAYEMINTDWV